MLRGILPLQGDLFFDVMTDSWGNRPGAFAWVLVSSVAGLLLLLVRFTISKWQTSRRCLVAVLSTLVMVNAISEIPPVSVDASPASLSSIDVNAIDAIQPVIMGPLRKMFLEDVLNSDSPKYLSANIAAKNLPPDTYCDWMQVNKPYSSLKSFRSHPFANQFTNYRALYHAIQKELTNVNVRNQHNDSRNQTSIMYQSSSAEGIYGKSISLRGVLCRVELVANIPFDTDGVSVPLLEGWIHAKRFRELGDSTPHVDLIMHGCVFGSGSIPSQLSWNVDVTQLRQVFLYIPKSGKAYYCRESDAFNGKGPLLSSGHVHRTIMSLTHTERFVNFDESDLEGARLLIFSPRILRLLDRTLVVPHDIPIESNQDSNHDADFVAGPEVAPKDFFVEAISRRPDPEKASDEEFGRWMLFCEGNVRMESWLSREYCEWLPEKMSIMLEGNQYRPHIYTRNSALFAVWPESRKCEVISQLPEKPWLLKLIAERGWLQDSKHEILQLFESGNETFDLLTHVAMLEEPSTYDRLLEFISISGNVSLYHALSRIPSLADPLDHAVKSYFARVTTRGLPPDGLASRDSPIQIEYLDVPLMHGLPDAMRDALVIFHACEAEKYTYTREHLAKHLILPAGIDYENNNSIPFFRDLRMENLQWDALARRWRINETSLPKP
jgi:hypothetical protein